MFIDFMNEIKKKKLEKKIDAEIRNFFPMQT